MVNGQLSKITCLTFTIAGKKYFCPHSPSSPVMQEVIGCNPMDVLV